MHVDGSTAEASKESVPESPSPRFRAVNCGAEPLAHVFARERKMDGSNRVMACQAAGVQPPHGRLHRHGPLVKLCVFLRRRKTPSAQPFLWTAKTPDERSRAWDPFLWRPEIPPSPLLWTCKTPQIRIRTGALFRTGNNAPARTDGPPFLY